MSRPGYDKYLREITDSFYKETMINLSIKKSNRKWSDKIDELVRELQKRNCKQIEKLTWENEKSHNSLYKDEAYRIYCKWTPRNDRDILEMSKFLNKEGIEEIYGEFHNLLRGINSNVKDSVSIGDDRSITDSSFVEERQNKAYKEALELVGSDKSINLYELRKVNTILSDLNEEDILKYLIDTKAVKIIKLDLGRGIGDDPERLFEKYKKKYSSSKLEMNNNVLSFKV